jgi:signal transduction histidine kinase
VRRLRPDHLAGQIALVILAAIALFHLTLTTVQYVRAPEARHNFVEPYESLAAAMVALDLAPLEQRGEALADLAKAAPWAILQVTDVAPEARVGPDVADDLGEFAARLWPGARVYLSQQERNRESEVVLQLRRGGYLVASTVSPRRPAWPAFAPTWPTRVFERAALFFLLCTTIVSLWLSRAVVAPLVKLAREAERFPDESCRRAPLAEAGPREVRNLTRAMNRMQSRIEAMIAARSHALAAISHDLRTIITRIKLRSEFVADEALRTKMLGDADLMDAMLVKNLQYLRDGENSAPREAVDLDSVLQTVCDQFADLGHKVSYNGERRRIVLGSITEMQRIFNNLVENAVGHANEVDVSMTQASERAVQIDVVDDGPGVAEADRARILEPFVRGETARTMTSKSGFGLGLSIVRTLVHEAGGSLELLDRAPHGLVARVVLPCASATE